MKQKKTTTYNEMTFYYKIYVLMKKSIKLLSSKFRP